MHSRIIRFMMVIALILIQGSVISAQQLRVEGFLYPDLNSTDMMEDGFVYIEGVVGAVVQLQMPSDTLFTTSDDRGRFLFKKVEARRFHLKVECLGYEIWEKDFDADTLGNNISLPIILSEKKERIAAAVVKEEAPVFEFVGDTLKYNVASTQQVSEDDMLQDVMDRLPGISVSNNLVKVMGEEVARIYVNGRLVFGDSVDDPLRYLAGSEVVSLKVFDQASRAERAGLAPKGDKKERVINVVTRTKINTALVAQAIAGYGRNFERLNQEMDNRYVAGLTGNWFSEMNLFSMNVYLNNVGRNNQYSAVSDISSIPSDYKRVGYAGAKFIRKFKDPELGDVLSASYSYGNTRNISESSLSKIYSADENWTSRTYRQDNHSLSLSDAHNVKVSLMSMTEYIPNVELSFSASGNDSRSRSRMENILDGTLDGYDQLMTQNDDRYKYSAAAFKMFSVKTGYIVADASVNGGYSHGGTVQRDSALVTSAVSSFVSEPQGEELNAAARLEYHIKPSDVFWIRATAGYQHQYSSVNKLRFADAVAEANLDVMTSDVHTYDYNTYRAKVNASYGQHGLLFSLDLDFRYDHQGREVSVPQANSSKVGYFSITPLFSLNHFKGVSASTQLVLSTSPVLPSYEQIRRDFDAVNPMYVTRGNPDLKKATDCNLQFQGSYMLGKSNSLIVSVRAVYQHNRITQKTRYIADDTVMDGYLLQKGTTFTTYDNLDGACHSQVNLNWSTRINALKLGAKVGIAYDFNRDPSYVEDRLNIALRHIPAFQVVLNSNFSRKYKLNLKTNTMASFVSNSRFADVSYLNQMVSLKSDNRITDWMFVNGEYAYSLRYPFQGGGDILQDHMLNAIVGFRLKKSGVELNLTCYDILNRTSSFKTKVLRNYTQTSFTPDFGRIWMFTVVWRFNSTQRGGSKVNVRYNAPQIGRDYENEHLKIRSL